MIEHSYDRLIWLAFRRVPPYLVLSETPNRVSREGLMPVPLSILEIRVSSSLAVLYQRLSPLSSVIPAYGYGAF